MTLKWCKSSCVLEGSTWPATTCTGVEHIVPRLLSLQAALRCTCALATLVFFFTRSSRYRLPDRNSIQLTTPRVPRDAARQWCLLPRVTSFCDCACGLCPEATKSTKSPVANAAVWVETHYWASCWWCIMMYHDVLCVYITIYIYTYTYISIYILYDIGCCKAFLHHWVHLHCKGAAPGNADNSLLAGHTGSIQPVRGKAAEWMKTEDSEIVRDREYRPMAIAVSCWFAKQRAAC